MPYQSGQNVLVAYKGQGALGTPASGAGGFGLRYAKGSQGLRLAKAIIESEEVRRDGQSTRGRHGSKSVTASYLTQLCVGELDVLFEAAMRGTWQAALAITQATMTSITTTTNTIVAAAGSWLTQGVREGDMVQLTNHSQAANNGKWFRVLSVTASTITVPPNSLTLDAGADTTFTLTVAKTLLNGATPVERYFTFDEHNQDIDESFTGTDLKVNRIEFVADPNKPVMVTVGLLGLDMPVPVSGASAPTLTSPTFTTTLPLVMSDGKIALNDTDFADLTGLRFVWDLGGTVPAVLAPNAPDAFLNNGKLSGSISGLRTSSARFTAFRNETQIDIFALCSENEAEPKDFHSFFIGNAVYDGNDGPIGNEGPLVENIPFRAGKDEAGGSRALTTLKMSSSAA